MILFSEWIQHCDKQFIRIEETYHFDILFKRSGKIIILTAHVDSMAKFKTFRKM